MIFVLNSEITDHLNKNEKINDFNCKYNGSDFIGE